MAYELTNEEKVTIINGRLRSLEFSKYDFELSIEEESSLGQPNAEIIASHQASIANIDLKKAALEAKLEEIS